MHTLPIPQTWTDSDSVLDDEVDYTCVGLFRDEILSTHNEDFDDESID